MSYDETSAFAYEVITVSTAAIGFTSGTITPNGSPAASRAIITAEGGQMRFRTDGTDPTASEGHLLESTARLEISGYASLSQFRAIRTGAGDGTLRVSYER